MWDKGVGVLIGYTWHHARYWIFFPLEETLFTWRGTSVVWFTETLVMLKCKE